MAKSEKRIVFGLILSCWLIYTFSMCMKMAYSGAMASIKEEYGVSHVTASLPITLYYSFYAVIQFGLAIFMSRINFKLYMAITFIISGLSFISVFFYSPMWYIGTVLALNGITLGAVWCGSVSVFGKYLSQRTMNNALLFMGIGFSAGSAMSYVVNAIAAAVGNWRIGFIVFGVAFLLATLYFLFALTRAEKAGIKPKAENVAIKKQVYKAEKVDVKPLIIMAIIITFFACVLYYGLTNWMPTILSNIFQMSNANSNLITTIFPVVAYVGPVLVVILCNRLKNDFLVSLIGCGISALFGLLLYLLLDVNVILTVFIIIVWGISLRAVNSLCGSLCSLHTREYVDAGKTSAIINAVACIAAAVSPFLISMILDASGNEWSVGFLVLFIFAVVMLVISVVFLIIREINRRKLKGSDNVA